MRSLSVVALALPASGLSACDTAHTQPDQYGMACVERLVMPRYPGLPQRARIRGDIEATVMLNAAGSIDAVRFATHLPTTGSLVYFRPEIEKVLRGAKFSRSCRNQAITVVFEFRLIAGVDDDYYAVAVTPPNRFEITASEPLVNP